MKIKPLAFDSLGVRSMATYIETEDLKLLIDPGVSLAPRRFGLPPHPIELKQLRETAKTITGYGKKSDMLIVTHYHYDHHDLGDIIPKEVYLNKTLYIKHPAENINRSQKEVRAPLFLNTIKVLPKKIEYADGRTFNHGKTTIKFSKAVYHGTNPDLGYVIEVVIDDGKEKILYTSDVEGPPLSEQIEFIIQEKPKTVMIDGPMGYMLNYKYTEQNLNSSIQNIKEVIKRKFAEAIILDHHFMRELEYKTRIQPLLDFAEKNKVKLCSAAEYLDRENNLLEARRRELYKKT